MSFSYFEAQTEKGQKYARLYPPKEIDKNLSCEITFDELQFQFNEPYLILTGKINTHSKGIEKSFKEHTCNGATVVIRLLNKREHTTTFKGEQKTTTQSTLEYFLCNRFSNLDPEKAYSGKVRFRYDGMLSYLLDVNPSLPQNMRDSEEKNAIDLIPLDTKTIELEELTQGKAAGFVKSGGQTELTRLNDRLTFVLEQMKVLFPDTKLENIADLIKLLSEDGNESGYVNHCLKTICDVATLNAGKLPPF